MDMMSSISSVAYALLAGFTYILSFVVIVAIIYWPLSRLAVKVIKRTDKHKVLFSNIATTIFAILLFTAVRFAVDYISFVGGLDFVDIILGLFYTVQFRNRLDKALRQDEKYTPDYRALESLLKRPKK